MTTSDQTEAAEPQPAPAPFAPPPGGQFLEIAFFGHIEHVGYVTEITLHGGEAAYHIDLPERMWGGSDLAWHEYAASALFSKRPLSGESVRAAWEAERERRARWAAQQDGLARPAIGPGDDDEDDWAGRDDDDLDDDTEGRPF